MTCEADALRVQRLDATGRHPRVDVQARKSSRNGPPGVDPLR